MIALDTNLLLYALDSASALHIPARRAIDLAAAHPEGWGVPLGCALEFWSVATRPFDGCRLVTGAEALAFLESLREAGAQFWQPEAEFIGRWLGHGEAEGIAGRRIFDFAIAATALDNGATELWTHDRGFRPLPGLRVFDPLRRPPQ